MKVRALIGPMSSAAAREGIARLLAAAPRGYRSAIAADQCDSWEDVLERVAAEPFDVLIAEFGAGSPAIDRLFQLQPKLSVIEVDPAGGTTNIHVFDVGSETLVRLAEWLSREAGLTGANDSIARITHARPQPSAAANEPNEGRDAVREREPEPGPEPKSEAVAGAAPGTAPPIGVAARTAPMRRDPYVDAGGQLEDVASWLALKLDLALGRAEKESGSRDGSNRAMKAARARSLPGQGAAELSFAELAAEFQEVDSRLTSRGIESTGLPLQRLATAFQLDEPEREMLYLALAPELDSRFARMFGLLAGDPARRRPDASLLADMVDELGAAWRVRQRLSGDRPFARFGLIAPVGTEPPGAPDTQIPLAVPPDVVSFLLGGATGDSAELRLLDPADPAKAGFDLQAAPVAAAARAAGKEAQPRPVVRLNAAAGEELWLAEQLAAVGVPVLIGTLAPSADATIADIKDKLRMFARQARLADAMLIVAGLDSAAEALRPELCAWLAATFAAELRLLVLQGRHLDPIWLRAAPGGVLEIVRNRPSRQEQGTIWIRAAAARGIVLSDEFARELAATFPFTRARAEAALAVALGSGDTDSGETAEEALRHAARLVSKVSTPPSVRRIETALGWDDIVLPPPIQAELRSIPSHVRHAETVWKRWGFGERIPFGEGVAALFAGPSGTGKTLAARIIAREIGSALFQVDLAKTISKHVGETEKALDRIFDVAEAASAVLLFEDADTLFGKRPEVRDIHDHDANLVIAYLLRRIEACRGLAILTTNLKEILDAALLRRLRFVVDFPMPDAMNRLAIWTRMFPQDAPVGDDVDLSLLARQLPLSGGNIEQCVVNAAFLAAENEGIIRMSHLVAATRAEIAKLGMESAGKSLTRLPPEAAAARLEP